MKRSFRIIGASTGLTLLAVGAGLSCSKSKDDKSSSQEATATYSVAANPAIHLTQTFNANTPKGFKSTTALQKAQLVSACATQYGQGSAETTACETMADIQQRFFGSGPTVIKDRLASLDSALNGSLKRASSGYVPCLDSKRTTEGTFTIAKEGGSTDITFQPYGLTTIALKSTFKNDFSLDTGDSLAISCFSSDSTASAQSGIGTGFGFKDGTWSLYELGTQAIGMFGTADKNDAINMWFRIGGTNPSALSAQAAGEVAGASFYAGSTGIAQIISNPQTGLVGISQVGSGIGPGCGARLLMNSASLYFEGNVNNYGACTATDYVAGAGNGTPAYNSSLVNVRVCMDVSGSSITPTTGITSCVKSGLVALDDNGDPVSPFEAAGLKNLTANMGSTATDVIKVRAWMGAFFMSDTDMSAVPPFGWVSLQPDESVEIEGYSKSSFSFTRTTDAAKQSSSVTAACNAADDLKAAVVEETFELTGADLVASNKAINTEATDESILLQLNDALKNTGDAAAVVNLSVSGIRGTTFHSALTGTATVALDGTTLGTGTLTLPTSSGPMIATASVALGSAVTLTSASKLTVTVSGTMQLVCDNAIATVRSVAVKPGLPSLVFYLQEKTTE